MYWEQRYPRLLTNEELLNLRNKGQSRLLLVADITCDKGGSIEFVKRVTSIHNPYYRFEKFYLINHSKPKSSISLLTHFGVWWGPQWEIRWKSSSFTFLLMSVTSMSLCWTLVLPWINNVAKNMSGTIQKMIVLTTTWMEREFSLWPLTAFLQNFRGR